MITIDDILAAQARIAAAVRHTPVMATSQLKDPPPGQARVSLKLECLQVTGSFKARGALNRLLGATGGPPPAGIVTASGGNHGLAVARTAFAAGVPATVFVPTGVAPAKIAKMRRWQAEVRVVGEVWDRANEAALAHAEATRAVYFHPFADPLVVAGQGTLGLEILDDLPDIDAILIAIGGGGLIAGVATALRARRPGIKIIGIEPEGSPTLKACLEAGELVTLPRVTTKVPTMACARTDPRILELVRDTVDDIVLVSDAAMQEAASWLWFETGIAADLSGAASLAALHQGLPGLKAATHVCALVCGAGTEGAV